MDTIKRNITLVIGISIPILMILFVAGSIYLPGLFIQPHYNFVYLNGDDLYYSRAKYQYVVQNGTLQRIEAGLSDGTSNSQPRIESKLYLHDVKTNTSTEISFADAQRLYLDSNTKSTDGFEIVSGSYGRGFFPFFYGERSDYNARYLQGHNVTKKLNLQSTDSSHYYSFRFIGWVQ